MPRLDWETTLTDRAQWLLEVDLSGATMRFATEELEVTDREGVIYLYRGGLSDLALSRSAVEDVSVELSTDDDWAELLQRGGTVIGARAVLRRWWPGQVLEEAEVFLDGRVSFPRYGARGQAISFSIRPAQQTTRDNDGFPPPSAKVDEDTWPIQAAPFVLPAADVGAYYPWVIGAPGHNAVSLVPYDAVIAVAGEHHAGNAVSLVVAGHRVAATAVRVKDPASDSSVFAGADATITHATDNRGRVVAVVTTSGLGLGHDPGSRWGVGFQDDSTYGCGIEFEGRPLKGAGAIIEWAMLTWSPGVRFDRARQRAQRVLLDGYRIDTWVNEPTTGIEFIENTLEPLLSVERVDGINGVYWQVMRYDATAQDAIGHLIAGHNCERSGAVGYSSDRIVNEVVVEYGRCGAQPKTYKVRAVTGRSGKLEQDPAYVGTVDPVLVYAQDDERVLGSMLARASQQRYGLRPQRIRTSAVWDDSTAVRIALSLIARYAWPRRVVQYTVGQEWDALALGDIITLTDSELYLADAVCLVTDVVLSSQTVVTLEILDDPNGGTGRRS